MNKKLPQAPQRENFSSQEAFEEALSYWNSHAGRIQAMRRSQDSRQQAKSKDDKDS